jgi:hypothetical protein
VTGHPQRPGDRATLLVPVHRALFPVPAILLLFLVLALVEPPDRTLFWDTVFDASHALLFGLVVLLVRSLLDRPRAPAAADEAPAGRRLDGARRLSALGITVVLAGASELLQLLQPGRQASMADFLRDVVGAVAFLLLHCAMAGRARGEDGGAWRPRVRAAGIAIALILAVLVPVASVVGVYVARTLAFPTLYRLDGAWRERPFVHARQAHQVTRPGAAGRGPGAQASTCFDLQPAKYAGVTLDEPYPDWSGFERLVFTISNPSSAPLEITIRVHDHWHDQRYEDRFNRLFPVAPGTHRIEIPLEAITHAPRTRDLDLTRVRGIALFAYDLKQPARVCLGTFRLE